MLPQAFLNRMQHQLGAEFPAFLESLERPRAVALRFNPRKAPAPSLPFVGSPVPWEPAGYYYAPDARPGLHPYHEAGVYYLQEASAMAPVALLDPQPGERICDLCAAPGGKSTQIAGRLGDTGFLLCNEIVPKRAKVLRSNIERMGISNALVTNETPQALSDRLPGFFHRVLVDAPCSGEGMFRKEEAAITDWSEETVAMCARRQQEILDAGARLVRAGGRLVYSTCTFSPEENEQTVAWFLEKYPDFSVEAVCAPWFSRGADGTFRLWPHKLLGEGHFVAVLRKSGNSPVPCVSQKAASLPQEWVSFAKELGISLPSGRPVFFGDTLYWAPTDMPDIARLKVLSPGLELGQIRKGRFTPAHALALWCQTAAVVQSYPADSRELSAYLHGETVPSLQRGWCLVLADTYPIGWGKGDGTVLKNRYPKGLRR